MLGKTTNGVTKMTPKQRAMLERIARLNHVLKLQLIASGGRSEATLNALRRAGYVRCVDHQTVKDRMGYPADAIEITDTGRAALDSDNSS